MPAVDPHPALAAAAAYIRTLVDPDEEGLRGLMDRCAVRTVPRRHYLSRSGDSIDEVYYIHQGLVRVVLVDRGGTEHTSHLAYEGLLFAEYTAYLTGTPAAYELQALEDTTVVAMPRAAIEWGYAHMRGGDEFGTTDCGDDDVCALAYGCEIARATVCDGHGRVTAFAFGHEKHRHRLAHDHAAAHNDHIGT